MFTVFSRRNDTADKCPQCRMINVDFLDLGFGLLACFQCGSVFVRKSERKRGSLSSVVGYREQVEKGLQEGGEAENETFPVTPLEIGIPGEEIPHSMLEVELVNVAKGVHENEKGEIVKDSGFPCEICGKVCKNKIGLGGHMRSHK